MKDGWYVVNPNIVKADIGNMSLAYLPDKEAFFVMNETAGMLLTILEQGKSKANLVKALNTFYPKIEQRVKERIVDSFIHLVLDNKIAKSSEESRISFAKIQLPGKVAVLDTPVISVYEKKWILQQHPDAVYDPKFSDLWSPAGNGS